MGSRRWGNVTKIIVVAILVIVAIVLLVMFREMITPTIVAFLLAFLLSYPVNWIHQAERRGTGHAVMQAMPAVPGAATVLVLLGDHPLIPAEVLMQLVAQSDRPLSLLTMELDDPTGYGRILRDPGGNIIGVVEHHDATPEMHEIREVNTGIIMVDSTILDSRATKP